MVEARSDEVGGRARMSTGVPGLDDLLGGGLIPGTLTVVVGATGIGKTQLGLQFAHAGGRDAGGRDAGGRDAGGRDAGGRDAGGQREGRRGVVFDMTARGDSQSHADYARRMFDWRMSPVDIQSKPALERFFEPEFVDGDYLHVFDYRGQRVTRRDLEWEQWQEWQSQLNTRLGTAIAFLYGNFVRGCRRVVVDGIEPSDRPGESIQYNLFEYVYHQILRKDPEWVARDLFRERYLANAAAAAAHAYDPTRIGCVLLCTSHESMLEDLVSRRLDEGDALSNANTLIFMGKVRNGQEMGRALYVAKHRGSECLDRLAPYRITAAGMAML